MRVKVLCLGRSAKELTCEEGTTVEVAIPQAGFPKDSSYTRHVNGTKSGRSRIIPMNDFLHAILAGMKSEGPRPEERIFEINYWSFGARFVKAVRRAKLDGKVSLHTLRHTFASHLLIEGVDLTTIQEILGHHDVTTTMIYAHLAPEHFAKSVQKLPF